MANHRTGYNCGSSASRGSVASQNVMIYRGLRELWVRISVRKVAGIGRKCIIPFLENYFKNCLNLLDSYRFITLEAHNRQYNFPSNFVS